MFDVFNRNKRSKDEAKNTAGVDFNANDIDDLNDEGDASNVADAQSSRSAQKGFFVICCVGMILLLVFMFFKNRIKNDEKEQVQAANQANKRDTVPKFQLPAEASAPANDLPPLPVEPEASTASAPAPSEAENQQTPVPTPHEIRLRSALMVATNESIQSVAGNGETSNSEQNTTLSENNKQNGGSFGSNPLGDSMNPTATPSATANRFVNRNLLLAKGTVIQCSLKTRIETQVAGMVACTTLRDTYSDNKKVLLLERGSIIEGEYQHTADMGQTRIFVLWTRIRTPEGVVVNINSPATDTLGGAGIGGYTEHHFWRRFGNALMFSLIQDGISTGFSRLEKSSTAKTVVYENLDKTTNDIVQEIIKSTSNIPPTIYKNQGDNAAVYVARDVDFSSVYSLRPRMGISPYSTQVF